MSLIAIYLVVNDIFDIKFSCKLRNKNENTYSDTDTEDDEVVDNTKLEKEGEEDEEEDDEEDEEDEEGEEGEENEEDQEAEEGKECEVNEDGEEEDENGWETVSELDSDHSDTESDDSSLSESKTIDSDDEIFDQDMDDSYYYLKLHDFPVQLIGMEKLNGTLDDLVKMKKISDQEWLAILFQICFGLSVAQKQFNFTHNDLHSSNIMFKNTSKPYLYFHFNGTYYRIPTFGKITKIIDFARGIFRVDKKQFFSDVFKKDGDAEGQYTYPYSNNSHIKHKPNPSFDLSYLAITIRDHFQSSSPIFMLLEKWTTDKYGNNLGHHHLDFELYIKIAHNVNSAVPKEQIKDPLFNQFRIKKDKIPQGEYIYYY
jgi:hypothetical protein